MLHFYICSYQRFSMARRRLPILVCQFLAHVSLVHACARTGGPGSNPPGTNPPEPCAPMPGQVVLHEDNSAQIDKSFYGEVPATSTCETCASGTTKYYPDSGEATIVAADEKAIGGVTCQNFCVCEADGTCFQRNSPDTSIVLYPYCDGSACSVYVLVLGQKDSDGIVSTDGSTTITSGSQVDPTTTDNLPVTQDSLYPKVTSISCNGCNFQMSC